MGFEWWFWLMPNGTVRPAVPPHIPLRDGEETGVMFIEPIEEEM